MLKSQQTVNNGEYRIIKTLGGGGFGVTYLAEEIKTNQLFVIKTLNAIIHGDKPDFEQQQDKFVTEALMLASCNHPNIVKIYPRFFREDGLCCIIMEYIEGESLGEYIQKNGILSEEEALKYIQQMANAVSYLHTEKSVLHRDLKPDNIMLKKKDNSAVLIDFGLAREVDFQKITTKTNSATPAYAPPEQFDRKGNFTPALDVYALAATLYHLLTAQPPHPPANFRQEFKIPLSTPKSLNPKISQRVNDAILKGLEIEAINRSQTVQTWLESLLGKSKSSSIPSQGGLGESKSSIPSQEGLGESKSSPPSQGGLGGLKVFNFEYVTVDERGNINNRHQSKAEYITLDLGKGVTLDMVLIPGGTFMMGTDDAEIARLSKVYESDWFKNESPQHEVTIKPFLMGKYPVTQSQWKAIMGNNPSHFKNTEKVPLNQGGRGELPVERVSYDDCIKFCKKLSQKTQKNIRLSTEAEWEYACRARTTTPFYFGETITTDLVNYDGDDSYGKAPKGKYRGQTTPVGKFPPNAFGLYDMHGNVWEWCLDNYHNNYQDAPNDGSAWLDKKKISNIYVLRGGSWDDFPRICRCALRYNNTRAFNYYEIGFRVMYVFERTP